jgi:hypothetical protein
MVMVPGIQIIHGRNATPAFVVLPDAGWLAGRADIGLLPLLKTAPIHRFPRYQQI